MANYSVYRRSEDALDRAVFVKQGFSWPAFLFTFWWCLWHRLWLAAAVVVVLLVVIGTAVGGAAAVGLQLIVMLAAGCWGNDLRRLALAATGHREDQLVYGRSLEEAELRYFASAGEAEFPAPSATTRSNPTDHEPLGLFGTA